MPSGAAVVRREGKRGVSWCVKWQDADGRQCWRTLGREPDWNETKARRERGKLLDKVERKRWRKPGGVTFAEFADRFMNDYLPGRNLKPSTDRGLPLDHQAQAYPVFRLHRRCPDRCGRR